MDEVVQLDYAAAARRQPWPVAAIIALIFGLCSGPIAVVVVWLSGVGYGISIVGGDCVAVVGVPVFAYCLWAYARLEGQERARGRALALIGLIATVLWSIGLVFLFCYIDMQLE